MEDDFNSLIIGKYSYQIFKKKVILLKKCPSFLFIERTEITINERDSNGLCVSIFIKYIGWCLGVIGKLNNE